MDKLLFTIPIRATIEEREKITDYLEHDRAMEKFARWILSGIADEEQVQAREMKDDIEALR